MRADRQRRQLQPGRPPLGARLQCRHDRGLQRQPHHLAEERRRLVDGEAEVHRPDLHQLTAGAPAGERERRIGPGGHGQGHLRGQVLHQERHRVVHLGRVDDVVVVEGQDRGAGEDVEIVDQAAQHGLCRRGAAALHQRERLRPRSGLGRPDRGHEVRQEAPEVGVAGIERQPRDPALLRPGLRQPLHQGGGLAEPGRRRDEDQARPSSVGAEQLREARARHQPATRRGQVQLGAQHGHPRSVGPTARRPPRRRLSRPSR